MNGRQRLALALALEALGVLLFCALVLGAYFFGAVLCR